MDCYQTENYIRANFDEILETYEKHWTKELNYENFSKIKENSRRIQFIANYKKHPIEDIIIIFKEEMEEDDELQDS